MKIMENISEILLKNPWMKYSLLFLWLSWRNRKTEWTSQCDFRRHIPKHGASVVAINGRFTFMALQFSQTESSIPFYTALRPFLRWLAIVDCLIWDAGWNLWFSCVKTSDRSNCLWSAKRTSNALIFTRSVVRCIHRVSPKYNPSLFLSKIHCVFNWRTLHCA